MLSTPCSSQEVQCNWLRALIPCVLLAVRVPCVHALELGGLPCSRLKCRAAYLQKIKVPHSARSEFGFGRTT